MTQMPTLTSERLLLRPHTLADALDVQRFAGDIEIAKTTLNIPHPYEDGLAEAWIETHQDAWENASLLALAITEVNTNEFIGGIGLVLHLQHDKANLGYWIGKPHWGKGYATEAARMLIHYGFTELNLNRIEADYFSKNEASGRVMQKLGMNPEGFSKQAYKKWEGYIDIERYAILKRDYESSKVRDQAFL